MPTDEAQYLNPYREAHGRHGSSFGVTLWASKYSQERRFEVVTQMCFLTGKRILDAGCSRGDFAAFMLERGVEYGRYVGIDGLCDVIEYAQSRGLRHAEFYCGDILQQPDVLRTGDPQIITISGTLNTMTDDAAMAVLDAAWPAAGETLIFNFLSDRVGPEAPPQEYPSRRLPTLKLLDWALAQTPDVQFRQDYFPHGHDATIMMRKT